MKNIPIEYKVRVNDILYNLSITEDINVGDLVLDMTDGCIGYIDLRIDDKVAIRYDNVAEVAVPISRLRKLTPALETNSLN